MKSWNPLYQGIAERLAQVFANDSFVGAERRLNVPRGWVYDLIQGRKKLSIDTAVRICELWGCSLDWLINGSEHQPDARATGCVPIVGVACASMDGIPNLDITRLQGTQTLEFDECEAIVVSGDSMLPLVAHGQKAIVGPPLTNFTDIFGIVTLRDSRRLIKRITRQSEHQTFVLTSLNEVHDTSPPVIVHRRDLVEVREVVGIDRRSVTAAFAPPQERLRSGKRQPSPVSSTSLSVGFIGRIEWLPPLHDMLTLLVGGVHLRGYTLSQCQARLRDNSPMGDLLIVDGLLKQQGCITLLNLLEEGLCIIPLLVMSELRDFADLLRAATRYPHLFLTLPITIEKLHDALVHLGMVKDAPHEADGQRDG